MSISLTVRYIYGVRGLSAERLGLDYDNYGKISVDPAECMGGDKGDIVYVSRSERIVVSDRNGYDVWRPLVSARDLPDSRGFDEEIRAFLLSKGVAPDSINPEWILHTDAG